MGESWIGIDVSYILIAMIFGVGVYVRSLQEKISELEYDMNELRNDLNKMRGYE